MKLALIPLILAAYNVSKSGNTGKPSDLISFASVQGVCDFSSGTSFIAQAGSQPAVAQLISGALVTVAQVSGQDGSGLGVYAYLNDKQFQVNTVSVFDQKNAQVAALNTGGFVVVYESTVALVAGQTFPREQRILFQIYDAAGQALGLENSADVSDGSRQDTVPSVAANDDGFVVTWISQVLVNDQPQNGVLVARGYGFDGVAVGEVFVVNTLNDVASNPQNIQRTADGQFVAVWSSQSACPATTVMARKLSLSSVIGPQFQVGKLTTANQRDPFVTTHTDGVVIAWANTTATGTTLIVFQSFDNQLTPLIEPTIVQEDEIAIQSQPYAVAFNNTTAILWNSFVESTGSISVQGVLFSVNGSYLQDIQLDPITPAAVQTIPAASFNNGNLTIVWTEDGTQIVGRKFQCSQDCQVSEWSDFTECTVVCGGGTQNRTRQVIQQPQLNGAECPVLIQVQDCNNQNCADPICNQCISDKCFLTQPGDRNSCTLAEIANSEERSFVVNRVLNGSQLYWINTWQGSNYGGLCLSISQYGAITVPLGGCSSSAVTSAVCQVAKPSNC